MKRGPCGFTLVEVLIAVVLITLVFLGAISLYTTGLRFLGTRRTAAEDLTTSPMPSLEAMIKNINLANFAELSQGDSQLNIRVDFECDGTAKGSPSDTATDNWWHYRFAGGKFMRLCNANRIEALSPPGNPPGTEVVDNFDTNDSGFTMINPSGIGAPTVVGLRAVTQAPAPVIEMETEVAVGAMPKR